jgi:hypothetical protein
MGSSTSKIFWLSVLLFSIVNGVLSNSAYAHEMRPALLQLTELETGRWNAVFKQPQVQGRFLNLKVMTNCSSAEADAIYGETALQETFELKCEENLALIEIEGLDGSLIDTMVTIEWIDGRKNNHLLSSSQSSLQLNGESPAVPVYLLLGIEHLVFGIDHVLFILVLLYVVSGWINLVKVITSFTVAHSITLGLAAFNVISVEQAPVEALIAFSIVLVAWESLRSPPGLISQRPWMVAFMFGLLHGLGFAGALMDIGLPEESAIPALFLFNVGIEVGQLAIVTVAMALVTLVQRFNIELHGWHRILPLYFAGSMASFWFIDRTMQILM